MGINGFIKITVPSNTSLDLDRRHKLRPTIDTVVKRNVITVWIMIRTEVTN